METKTKEKQKNKPPIFIGASDFVPKIDCGCQTVESYNKLKNADSKKAEEHSGSIAGA